MGRGGQRGGVGTRKVVKKSVPTKQSKKQEARGNAPKKKEKSAHLQGGGS